MFGTVADYERKRVTRDRPATSAATAQDLENIGKLAIEAYLAKRRFRRAFAAGYKAGFIAVDPLYEVKRLAANEAAEHLARAVDQFLAAIDKSD